MNRVRTLGFRIGFSKVSLRLSWKDILGLTKRLQSTDVNPGADEYVDRTGNTRVVMECSVRLYL